MKKCFLFLAVIFGVLYGVKGGYEVKKKLIRVLKLEKTDFLLYEPIMILTYIKNPTSQEIVFNDTYETLFLKLKVVDDKGKVWPFRGPIIEPRVRPYATLAPGDSLLEIIDMGFIFGEKYFMVGWYYLPCGRYKVWADSPYIRSNVIEFTVRMPEGDEKEPWLMMKKAIELIDKKLRDKAREIWREVIKKYKNTRFSLWSKYMLIWFGLEEKEERKEIAYSLIEESPNCYYVGEAIKPLIIFYPEPDPNFEKERKALKKLIKRYKNTLTGRIAEQRYKRRIK